MQNTSLVANVLEVSKDEALKIFLFMFVCLVVNFKKLSDTIYIYLFNNKFTTKQQWHNSQWLGLNYFKRHNMYHYKENGK